MDTAQESPWSLLGAVSGTNESRRGAHGAVNIGWQLIEIWAVVACFFSRGRCLDLFPENESTTIPGIQSTINGIFETNIGVLKWNLDQATT